MDAAGDRRLERLDVALGAQRREALQLVRVVGAHVDPGAARAEPLEHAARAGDHLGDGLRRRQAGDESVGGLRRLEHGVGAHCAVPLEVDGARPVDVVHGHGEAGAQQAAGQVPAEGAEPDVADPERH